MYLHYSNACRLQDRIWFSNGIFNGWFSLNIQEFSIKFEGRIPFLDEDIQWAYASNGHCCYRNKIYMFPSNCDYVLCYDVEQDNMQGIPLLGAGIPESYGMTGIVQYCDCVWLFPVKLSQGIFRLDLDTLKFGKTTEFDNALEGVDYIFNSNVIKISDTEIALLSGNNTIIEIDLLTKKRICCKHFNDNINIWGIRYDNGSFWLLTYDSTDVYEWIKEEDRLERYCLTEEEWIHGKGVPYVNMVFLNNQIVLLPCCLKYVMKVDKGTHWISKAADYPDGFRFLDSLDMYPAFSAFDIIDDYRAILHPLRGNMLLVYDSEKNHIDGKLLTVRKEDIFCISEILCQSFRKHIEINYESDLFGMEFLELVMRSDMEEGEVKETHVGKSIYDTLKF